MKRVLFFLFVCVSFLFCAESLSSEMIFGEPTIAEYDNLVKNIQDAGSPTWYASMFVLIQALFLIFRTSLGDLLGIYKLLILATLSLTVTILTNILSGKSFLESLLLDSGTLMAYQVLAYQVKKQWEKRGDESSKFICGECGARMRSEEFEA